MTLETSHQRRAERMKQLVQTAGDTDMGKLLRKFWHPVAISKQLAKGTARPLRILGENLTLYRGASGQPYLVGGRCAHHLAALHTGWVEGEQIRCMLHGWKYDGRGQCVERPAEEDAGLPDVRITGYPVHEYGELIFAYFGAEPAPPFELPRKDVIENPGSLIFTMAETWDCNWFQITENAMDGVHVSFVHQMGQAGPFGTAVSTTIPKLEYIETEAGARQIATRSKSSVRISDWTFPNCNHVNIPGLTKDDPWIESITTTVPVDDEYTTRFIVWVVPSSGKEADRKIAEHFEKYGNYNPADHRDELFGKRKYPQDYELVQLVEAQDYVAMRSMGVVADRVNEWLGKSDTGIVFLRNIFWRELAALRNGQPTKQWRKLDRPADMPIQVAASAGNY
jgi:5,5'-dehydrodivanillate O-demethylase